MSLNIRVAKRTKIIAICLFFHALFVYFNFANTEHRSLSFQIPRIQFFFSCQRIHFHPFSLFFFLLQNWSENKIKEKKPEMKSKLIKKRLRIKSILIKNKQFGNTENANVSKNKKRRRKKNFLSFYYNLNGCFRFSFSYS